MLVQRVYNKIMPERIINNLDIVKGIAEVSLDTVKRVASGVIHLATQHIQHEGLSDHHTEHVTDRPATYSYPTDSEGTPV